MILLDSSGVLSALDLNEVRHRESAAVLSEADPRLLSPFVLAELDYLLVQRSGQQAELAFLAEVANGAYRLEIFSSEDVRAAQDVITRYADLGLGLADASIVVLAERYDCSDILTLDERHFRAITRASGKPFRIVPTDTLG